MNGIVELLAPALLKKLVDESYKRIGSGKINITKRKLNILIERIIKNNKDITKVKTLWHQNTMDLNEFYISPMIMINNKRKEVTSVDDKDFDDNVLIQGIAGQGKSILLKKLCSIESKRGVYVPIFFELRKIKDGVLKNIKEYLNFNGWDNILEQNIRFDHVYSNVSFLFFLDGLDEVPSDNMNSIIEEIDGLAKDFKNHRFIVSSRFNSGLEYSNRFGLANIDNLKIEKNEHVPLLLKLSDDQELTKHVINEIHNGDESIRELLITPLYVTLLFINFKSQRGMPAAITEFYNELFSVLLKRHDQTKVAFTRNRLVNDLGDFDFRKIYNGFCFASKEFSKTNEFKKTELIKSIDISKVYYDKKINSCDYLNDIITVTSLMVKEGDLYQFIHKSVQEFFASSFVSSSPEKLKKQFYEVCLNDQTKKWRQELIYLETEDSYSYTKYFLIPIVESFLCTKIKDIVELLRNPKGTIFKRIFKGNSFVFTLYKKDIKKSSLSLKDNLSVNLDDNNIDKFIDIREIFYSFSLERISHELTNFIQNNEYHYKAVGERFTKGYVFYSFSFDELCKYKSFINEMKKIDQIIINTLFDKVTKMNKYCSDLETLPILGGS